MQGLRHNNWPWDQIQKGPGTARRQLTEGLSVRVIEIRVRMSFTVPSLLLGQWSLEVGAEHGSLINLLTPLLHVFFPFLGRAVQNEPPEQELCLPHRWASDTMVGRVPGHMRIRLCFCMRRMYHIFGESP